MSYCYIDRSDRNNPKVKELIDIYGVDLDGNTTLLGNGAYKEVHQTNIPGTVMVITACSREFDKESYILDILDNAGYPAMKYHSIEKIGNTIFALADRLFPVDCNWGRLRILAIEKTVFELMSQMFDEGIFPTDLQYMVDQHDCPVFTDPYALCDEEDFHEYNRNEIVTFYACCKDERSNSCVEVRRTISTTK